MTTSKAFKVSTLSKTNQVSYKHKETCDRKEKVRTYSRILIKRKFISSKLHWKILTIIMSYLLPSFSHSEVLKASPKAFPQRDQNVQQMLHEKFIFCLMRKFVIIRFIICLMRRVIKSFLKKFTKMFRKMFKQISKEVYQNIREKVRKKVCMVLLRKFSSDSWKMPTHGDST